MHERWKDIEGFEGYQVSNKGRVRTFHNRGKRLDKPKIMLTSDDGNGYQKLMLYDSENNKRYCRKVHRLVAEAFIPKPKGINDLTVDHIHPGPEGKLDNSVDNLRWISRRENVQKAYVDGVCNNRIEHQKKVISCTDTWLNEDVLFESTVEASKLLGIKQSTICHAMTDNAKVRGRYIFERVEGEEALLYDHQSAQRFPWL